MTQAVDVLGPGQFAGRHHRARDDDYLVAQEMVKGAMTLIDEDRAEALYAARVEPTHRLRRLGGQHDRRRRLVRREERLYRQGEERRARRRLRRRPPRDRRLLRDRAAEHGPATGRCFVYVTPDGERTMNTYLGASTYLSPPDVDEALVRAARFVYLEGYMWDRPAAKSAFQKAAEIAHAGGRTASR